eukprot:762523-Hanusia_phi.AAC.2
MMLATVTPDWALSGRARRAGPPSGINLAKFILEGPGGLANVTLSHEATVLRRLAVFPNPGRGTIEWQSDPGPRVRSPSHSSPWHGRTLSAAGLSVTRRPGGRAAPRARGPGRRESDSPRRASLSPPTGGSDSESEAGDS